MSVVERRRTDAHGDVNLAAVSAAVGEQRTVSAGEYNLGLIVEGVADVVGSGVDLGEVGGGALQFGLHDFHYRIRACGIGLSRGAGRSEVRVIVRGITEN